MICISFKFACGLYLKISYEICKFTGHFLQDVLKWIATSKNPTSNKCMETIKAILHWNNAWYLFANISFCRTTAQLKTKSDWIPVWECSHFISTNLQQNVACAVKDKNTSHILSVLSYEQWPPYSHHVFNMMYNQFWTTNENQTALKDR